MTKESTNSTGKRSLLIYNPQFWSIVSIFILITLHHYDDQTMFRLFARFDLPLGLTRHTVDRILYLIPIILSSIVFGFRGGISALMLAFVAMMPRALFISSTPTTAVLETLSITLVGSLPPLWAEYHAKQEEQLQETMEQLESTQKELDSTVRVSQERRRQLSVINAFSVMLSQSLDLDQVMNATVDMVMGLMDFEVVLIFSLDEKTGELRLITYKGIREESARALDRTKLGQGLCGQVAQTGQPISVDDVVKNVQFYTAPVAQERLRTEFSVPLTSRGKILGTLCVATRAPHQIREGDLELLSALGNLIGVAMEKATLYQERQKTTEQLKTSEKKYRQLFENAHDAIWVQDPAGRITAANQAAAKLFGYNLAKLIGADVHRFIDQQDNASFDEIRDDLLSNGEMSEPYRLKVLRKNGSEAFIMLTANLLSRNGGKREIQFIALDITKEVRMQENQSFYLQQITKAHEEERLRISRDLHDSTAQILIAALHRLENFCKTNKQLPEPELEFLHDLHEQLKKTLQDIRQLSRDLRPSILDDLGLMPTVEWLIEQLKTEHGIEGELVTSGSEQRYSPEIEVALFRIIQEALRNIGKHAAATKVKVLFECHNNETILAISDDGKGFELPVSMGEFSRAGKLGVDGMQTRARLIGGTFDLYSEPGKGTTIVVTVPHCPIS